VQAFLDILHGSWKSQALHAAAELGIPDVLAGGPRTAGEVADAVAAAERPVRQLLRALCTIGVCVTADGDRFGLGPMGEPLRSDAATPLRDWTRWWGKHLWGPWGVLDQCVRSGQSGRRILGGTTGFEHLTDPGTAALFHRAVAELTAVAAAGIVAAVDFGRFGTVMDVGGGGGELLGAVLGANPSVTGLMLEREHAIATARGLLEAAGVLSRCTLLEGDFFEHVPPTADAYLLKSILHDWDDEECVAVLASVRQAMHGRESAGVTLLVIEQVMPDRPGMHRSDQAFVRSDLMMLVAHGSCERTASEFAALLTRSGFAARSVTPAGLAFSVIEAIPV
jgi:hypothetical protein